MPTRRETLAQAGALLATALAQAQPKGQGTERLTVPFEYAAGLGSLLVRGRINRRPALLVLDTGSSHTIVTAAFLGVKPPAPSPARPGVGILSDAIGEEVTLELGPRVSQRRRVAVMDLSSVLSPYKERIDGLLGLDFFSEFSRVILSFADRTVTLVR